MFQHGDMEVRQNVLLTWQNIWLSITPARLMC